MEAENQDSAAWERLDQPLLALTMEEQCQEPRMKVASRSWKRQGNILRQNLQKKRSPANTMVLAQQDNFGLLTFRTVR